MKKYKIVIEDTDLNRDKPTTFTIITDEESFKQLLSSLNYLGLTILENTFQEKNYQVKIIKGKTTIFENGKIIGQQG